MYAHGTAGALKEEPMTSVTTARTGLAVVCFFACALAAAVAAAGPVAFQVSRAGTTMLQEAPSGSGDLADVELSAAFVGGDEDGVEVDGVFDPRPLVNRTIGAGPGQPVPASAARRAEAKPQLSPRFDRPHPPHRRVVQAGR